MEKTYEALSHAEGNLFAGHGECGEVPNAGANHVENHLAKFVDLQDSHQAGNRVDWLDLGSIDLQRLSVC